MKQILITLSVMQSKFVETNSLDQVVLNYYKNSQSQKNSSVSDPVTQSVFNRASAVNIVTCTIAVLVALFLICFLVHKIITYCNRRVQSYNTKLFLLFQCQRYYDLVCLMTVTCSKENLDFVIKNQINNIRIENCLQPFLLFDWNLKFSNKISGHQFPLPRHIRLSWIQAWKLRRILQEPFTVQILYKVNNKLQEFHFSTPEIEPNTAKYLATPHNNDSHVFYASKLYPTL